MGDAQDHHTHTGTQQVRSVRPLRGAWTGGIWRGRWPPLTSVEATAHALAGLPPVVVAAVMVLTPVITVTVVVTVTVTAKEATPEDI